MTDAEKAKQQAESFAASTRRYGAEELRKITQSGMTILAIADNRFVDGFTPDETAKLQKGNVLPFTLDIVQWIEVCRADKEQLRKWMSNTTAFQDHCYDLMASEAMDMKLVAKKFSDVFAAYQEILGAKVEVKQPKQQKGAHGGQQKKKASSRRSKPNTATA